MMPLPARCICLPGFCLPDVLPARVAALYSFQRWLKYIHSSLDPAAETVGRRAFSAFAGPAGVLDEVGGCATRACRSIRSYQDVSME